MRMEQEGKLDRTDAIILRQKSGFTSKAAKTNAEIRELLSLKPVSFIIKKRSRRRWFGHVLNVNDDSDCKATDTDETEEDGLDINDDSDCVKLCTATETDETR